MSDWHEAARVLREADPSLSYADIGRLLGHSRSAVNKALNPDRAREYNRRGNAGRNPAKRAWANEHDRATCSRCGGPMGVGTHRQGCTRCMECRKRETQERLAEMIRLRNEEGLGAAAIAARLGTSPAVVSSLLYRARRRGVVVARDPYMENRRGV